MNRLNMLWALGALSCPLLATHSLRTNSPRSLLVTVGLVFGFIAMAIFLASSKQTHGSHTVNPATASLLVTQDPGGITAQNPIAVLPTVPLVFAAFAALTVGVESALGGWLATYAGRSQHGVLAAVSVASAFWAGLLLSRALHTSRFVERLAPSRWLQVHAAITLASVPLIAITHDRAHLFVFALLAGSGLGPIYPLTLGYVLPRYRGRLIFVLAGLGSAFFPWATGTLSTELHSIRESLIACCVAAAGVAALSLVLRPIMMAQPDLQEG